LKKYLVEESFEALEAINEGDAEHMKEELGDVILNVVEIAALCEKQGLFSVEDIVNSASEKMIRRHPHVFQKKQLTMDELHTQWDKIKKDEGKTKKLTKPEKYAKMQDLLNGLKSEYEEK
jgi:uncharacterized protein YabN with tetrapyrrole methylase and pyrophosphatase domain